MWKLLCCCALFFSGAINAQVYKCKDAAGKLFFSDTVCATGHTGGQVEVRPNVLDGSEGRALDARQSYQAPHQFQQGAPAGNRVASKDRSDSLECQIAQKNAWGADRRVAQKKADLACLRSTGAAAVEAERTRNRPVQTSCISSYGYTNCFSR